MYETSLQLALDLQLNQTQAIQLHVHEILTCVFHGHNLVPYVPKGLHINLLYIRTNCSLYEPVFPAQLLLAHQELTTITLQILLKQAPIQFDIHNTQNWFPVISGINKSLDKKRIKTFGLKA
jgi:hypothetical protein